MPEPRPDTTDFITWLIALSGMIVTYRCGLHVGRQSHMLTMERDAANRVQSAKDQFYAVISDYRGRFQTGLPRDENGDAQTEDRCLGRSIPAIARAINDLRPYISSQSISSLEATLADYKAYAQERDSSQTRMDAKRGITKPERHTEFLNRFEEIVKNAPAA